MIQTRTFLLALFFFVFSFAVVFGQTTSPVTDCSLKSNTTCEECLKNVSCLWCISSQKCMDYPVKSILPSPALCPLSDARWGMCWMNFQAFIISIIAAVIIFPIFFCCLCCCKCNICRCRTMMTFQIS